MSVSTTEEKKCRQKQPPDVFYKKRYETDMKLYQKETLAQVFSCEFCKIFKSTLFTEHLWTTASVPCHSSNER